MTNHILNYRENASSSWKQIPIVSGGGSGNVTLEEFTKAEIEEICDFEAGLTEDDVVPIATDTMLGCVIASDGLDVDANGKLRVAEDLLWENASPTSSFASQTISLDLSEYKYVIITYWSTNNELCYFIEAEIDGNSYAMHQLSQLSSKSEPLYVYTRVANVKTTGVTFTTCTMRLTTSTTYLSNNGSDNIGCLPLKIYGIKGGVS